MMAGECYQIPFGTRASEATELFTKRMVTKEKRSVHKLSVAQPYSSYRAVCCCALHARVENRGVRFLWNWRFSSYNRRLLSAEAPNILRELICSWTVQTVECNIH
jgi:hypothetical protein